MKNVVLNYSMNAINKYYNFDKIKLQEIKYGLESVYLTITKFVVILILSILLKCTKEVLLFMFIYSFIKKFVCGIHAAKSWQCWVSSIPLFLLIPMSLSYIKFNIVVRSVILTISLIIICLFAPADTKKKPMIYAWKRKKYKILAIIIGFVYYLLALIIKNNLIINLFMYALVLSALIINPLTYKIFKQPYNNYKYFKM